MKKLFMSYSFIIKASAFGLYSLLCATMFSDIVEELIEKLQITNSIGNLITTIGLSISLVIFLVRLIKENEQNSYYDIYKGCILFFFFIVINLMDAHIISVIFYFFIRMTLGYIYKYLNYAVNVWTAGLALKIGLGIFLILIILLIYIAIMYYVLTPNAPLLLFLATVLSFIGDSMADGGGGSNVKVNDSSNELSIGEIVSAGIMLHAAHQADEYISNLEQRVNDLENGR